ncbi:MAG: peptidase, partial [Mucilaginibacter sp.]|nr:peptidase [Mucilaginibacter sp.]
MKKLFTPLLLLVFTGASAQKLEVLTVEKIMRDPKWMGVSPSNIQWSNDSKKIYFNWNPDKAKRDELYNITIGNIKPQKVSIADRKALTPDNGKWNRKHTLKTFEKNGDIYLLELKSGKIVQLTNTADRETNPTFSGDESSIIFTNDNNLFALKLGKGELVQLTNFIKSASSGGSAAGGGRRGATGGGQADNEQERWLKNQQMELFDIIKVNDKDKKLDSAERKMLQADKLKEINIGDKTVGATQLSPDGRYVTYRLTQAADGAKSTIVPNYVTSSGYTEDIPNRTKVGSPQSTSVSYIFDKQRDTVYSINIKDIPGIKDLPDYVKDYPKQLEDRKKANADRKVDISATFWSEDGKNAVVVVESQDNKDRW